MSVEKHDLLVKRYVSTAILANFVKLKSFLQSFFSGAMCVTLVSCASNAPAPVFDITLAEKVISGLKSEPKNEIPPTKLFASKLKDKEVRGDNQYESQLAISSIQPPPSTARNTELSAFRQEQKQPNITHVVKRGDTLYSIAWQYSLDHKLLAETNGLGSGAIYPGQVLKVDSKFISKSSKARNQNKDSGEKRLFNKSSLVAALNKEIISSPLKSAKTTSNINQNSSKSRSTSNRSRKLFDSKVQNWIWPVNGKVIKHFSNRSSNSKGVDISAQNGAAVRASAKGKVVYSGSGLRGYGQLVIIKHNDLFLSAYAHNEKVHVNENEFVKAGQKIADLGSSGTKNQKLHFEIRYKGKPVDPLNYLPKTD